MCPPGYHHNGFVATVHYVPKCMSFHKVVVVITGRAQCFMIAHMLCTSCFGRVWALGVSWITYDHLCKKNKNKTTKVNKYSIRI